jgi:hypothetical protein
VISRQSYVSMMSAALPYQPPSPSYHTDLVRQNGREYSIAPEGIDAETDLDWALGVSARG